ncbi:hypothetical protein L6164_020429 [Bauhinia variegata]|uniref:Uncharacterized protein n=1 Tax=Bauhinia variegata TaxID=167791 RepID=A0ACB9MUZ6_BAUVA|nr:hypothetical protein L6164_020429 [Bauhinia variegata]
MELFPAQPDLSLQISPPNSKPTSGWRRSAEEEVDLGFWKRAWSPEIPYHQWPKLLKTALKSHSLIQGLQTATTPPTLFTTFKIIMPIPSNHFNRITIPTTSTSKHASSHSSSANHSSTAIA